MLLAVLFEVIPFIDLFVLQVIGNRVLVKVVKNKHAPPYKTAEFEIEFGKGVCREAELIQFGCKYKLIRQAASCFYMNDQTFRGKDALKKFLSENTSAREELERKIRDHLSAERVHENESAAASDTTDEAAVAAI